MIFGAALMLESLGAPVGPRLLQQQAMCCTEPGCFFQGQQQLAARFPRVVQSEQAGNSKPPDGRLRRIEFQQPS